MLAPGTICGGQSGDITLQPNNDIVATLTDGAAEVLSYSAANTLCGGTLRVGTIGLGTANYITSGTVTFSGNGSNDRTEVRWTAANRSLVLKLGKPGGTTSTVTSATATYTPDSLMTDIAGNPAWGSASVTGKQF